MGRILFLSTLVVALGAASTLRAGDEPKSASKGRVFELRTYYPHPGRSAAMHKRFRDHTCTLFKKHGMELIGFWSPQDEKDKDNLIYILAFPSREAAKASWKAFQDDPEWKKVRDESERDGKIVAKVVSVYMDPTDYSDLK